MQKKEEIARQRAELAARRAHLTDAQRSSLEKRLRGQATDVPQQTILQRTSQGPAPLSFAQQRLWFLDQLEPGSAFYNIPVAVRLIGTLSEPVLEKALATVIARHETLRTRFVLQDVDPVQVIDPVSAAPLPVIDLSALPKATREAETRRVIKWEVGRAFDLARGPLLRASLLRLGAEEHVLLANMHHIVSDAWSMGVFVQELVASYLAAINHRPPPLPALPIQYADFAVWQRQWLQGETLEKQLQYWKERLSGAPETLELPTDRPRPPVQSLRGANQTFEIPMELTASLRALSRAENATLFMTLLSAFQMLLHRHTGQTDIVVGSPIANRDRVEIEGLIGFFVNTLVLRSDLSGDPRFVELLARVRETTLGAYAHQDVPFETLVEVLQPERNMSSTPLFQVAFALQNVPGAPPASQGRTGLVANTLEIESQTTKFDLSLTLTENKGRLLGSVEYSTDLFDWETIDRLVSHYQELLAGIVAEPQRRLSELSLLSEMERRRLLVEWNDTRHDYSRERSTPVLLAGQAASRPDATAVTFDGSHLSYAELNRRANQVAHYLRGLGVGPGTLVCTCLERSPEMVIGLLGIFKAGAAYVPIDPAYPADRVAFMLSDSRAPVVLTSEALSNLAELAGVRRVRLDADWPDIARAADDDPAMPVAADHLAYVIYTSGSTGTPKGVMIPHAGLLNLIDWHQRAFEVSASDRATQISGPGFDASVWELWPYLTAGASIHVAPEAVRPSPEQLGKWLVEQAITISFLPTPLAEGVLWLAWPEGLRLRRLLTGGDKLHQSPKPGLGFELVNNYGPTESTVVTTSGAVLPQAEESVTPSIGKPIANTRVYVLDRQMQLAPIGAPGELCVGGASLAWGYLNQPELTAEKFVPDPFTPPVPPPSETGGAWGGRLYRTGDLVRWLPDGRLEFLGRIDFQVKIRGFRIELGEIEATLARHPSVREAAVLAREDRPGEKRLVAYLVPLDGEVLSPGELRGFLQQQLPDYMLPSTYITLESMPLTPNGKVDRRALPAPQGTSAERAQEYVAARTPIEEKMAAIWREVLQADRIGIRDNFFELGGHSLLATQVASRIRQVFEVEVGVRALFNAATVEELSQRVEEALRGGKALSAPPIRRVPREGGVVLSFAQERLWFLDQLEPENPFYNVPMATWLAGEISVPALEAALTTAVERHEILRTRFVVKDSKPVQVIDPPWAAMVPLIDLTGLPVETAEAEARRVAVMEARHPFDLATGPLARVKLLRLGAERHLLVATMHHIIIDGWSMRRLSDEITRIFMANMRGEALSLPPRPIQYADFAVWQREWLQGEALEEQFSYWKQQMAGALVVLDLPSDRPRPPVLTYRGGSEPFQVPAQLTAKLQALSRAKSATLFMTMLAAFDVLLYRYTGQDDILVGTPIANRNHAEIEEVVGFFVNTLALRMEMGGNPTFLELLGRVKEATLGAYAHQDLPFEMLVEAMQPERDMSRSPLFQVTFVLQDAAQMAVRQGGRGVDVLEVQSQTSKFDLTFIIAETADGLSCSVEYSTDLFDRETIVRMVIHYQTLLADIVAEPERRLSELSLLTAAEREQVLSTWNATQADYPRERRLHELFEAQALRTPEALALIAGDERLSYAELNARANRLARYLRRQGVGVETLVGVCLDRRAELVISVLGVLKAGAAYVPLDPTYPEERLRYSLEDTSAPVVVTQAKYVERVSQAGRRVVCIDDEWGTIEGEEDGDLHVALSAENVAYVIYTSGSTGRPKGVMLSHGGATAMVGWAQREYGVDDLRQVLASTSVCFDLSVYELFVPLSAGGAVALVDNALALAEMKSSDVGVTLVNTVPSAMAELARLGGVPSSVRVVNLAGEPLNRRLVEGVYEQGVERVYNLYGPTEDTTYSTWEHVARDSEPTIGRAVSNSQLYILDERLEPMPIGVVGEIYLGGAGLARGYHDRPELTAEKFIPNPFTAHSSLMTDQLSVSSEQSSVGGRLYRTGDLGRWLADGRVEFLGRRDHQVKVRGFRIELGEIESVLSEHAQVATSVIMAREDEPGRKQLVGYVVFKPEATASESELREHLRRRLPDYMIPAMFVFMEALPLTPNGKVDRRALPAPESSRRGPERAYIAPRTPIEEQVAAIWSEVLGVEQIGAYDNFFELGGHSLLATQMMSRIRQVFGVELALRLLFSGGTVVELSRRVEEALKAEQSVSAPPLRALRGERELPLSYAQQRLWFLDQLEPGSASYNLPMAMRLMGPMSIPAMEAALTALTARHETLRTRFVLRAIDPVQVIDPPSAMHMPVIDLTALPRSICEAEARRAVGRETIWVFDLAQGPLLRASLLRLDVEEHVLLVNMHHIISDGWSMGVFIQELAELYQASLAGQASPLPPLPIQYGDFAVWQREWLQGEVLEEQLGYWKRQLTGAPGVLELPADRPRPVVESHRGANQTFEVPAELAAHLRALSRAENATLFMLLLATFDVLLYRYTGQADIVVGTPIANRNRAEIEGLIGFFVNTLVLRTEMSGEESFRELVSHVRDVTLGAYAHQDVPFEMLVEALQPERDMSRSPLFQVMFTMRNASHVYRGGGGLDVSALSVESAIAKFDLTLSMEESEGQLRGNVEYSTDLFDRETIERMVSHYLELLGGLAADPQQRISDLPLMPEAEARRVLVEWNAVQPADSREGCTHELFEAQAARTPDATVVVFEEQHLSYAELNRRANQLARHLRGLGVGLETLTGLCLDRSPEAVIGLLGILKAGGVYLPLDPTYPAERLAFMLADSGASVVLTSRDVSALPDAPALTRVYLDADWPAIAQSPVSNLQSPVSPDNLAYVIYTSGSTGVPKGVLVSHGALADHCCNVRRSYALTAADRVLQFATLSFDTSLEQIAPALTIGAALVLRGEGLWPLEEFCQLAADLALTVINLPTAYWHQVARTWAGRMDAPRQTLRLMIVGGEAMLPESLNVWRQTPMGGARLLNAYGPTETTVTATVFEVDAWPASNPVRVPIGRPMANRLAYVVDERGRLAPIGVLGELWLGGVGLARGYLNRPDATAEKFVPAPSFLSLSQMGGDGGGRLYRTGDLARYLPDGSIEFLGRVDHQVKVRGFRIELGEIEAALARHPVVREAIVLAREDRPGEKRLVAYLTPREGQTLSIGDLRSFLQQRLPDYMLPSAYMTLAALPLLPNGKLDRRALPAPEDSRPETGREYVEPRTPIEEQVGRIWGEVLGVEQVGVYDNFFELGGHSLLATQVMSRIRQVFGVELALRTLFSDGTVAELARQVDEKLRAGQLAVRPSLQAFRGEGGLPLSYAQQRLWFLDRLAPGSAFYNIPLAIRLTGSLPTPALAAALTALTARHETLRTRFVLRDADPVQVIDPPSAMRVPVIDLAGLEREAVEAEVRRLVMQESGRAFDLAQGPLLRASLLRLDAEEHVLLVNMHHIISDGWSSGVFVQELAMLYQASLAGQVSPLPPLPIQYGDFAVWQREWLQGEVLEEQLGYWKRQLAGAPGVLELPTDRPRPAVESHRGAVQTFEVPAELTAQLRALSRAENATLFMLLLAAFDVLLYRYTGQADIVVGTPIANRNRAEIEGLIGFFVNTLVLRTKVKGAQSFQELVSHVRDVTLGAYAHQDVPFEMLVEALQPERDMSRSPLFQVMFTMQNASRGYVSRAGLGVSTLSVESDIAKFDLTLLLEERPGKLVGGVEYSTDLFDRETIERMVSHYLELLAGLAVDPQRRISDLPLMPEAEVRRLLVAWNATQADYPRERRAHELFEAQAARTPDATAVVFEGQHLSYAELNRRANRAAHYLRGCGVGPDSLVAICMDRSPEMVIGLLGVLKAGGAYVPLDPTYPVERLAFMLADSGASVMLTAGNLANLPDLPGLACVHLDADWPNIARACDTNLNTLVEADNLAYIIYTSGSTGTPKGVMVSHRGLVNYLSWCADAYRTADGNGSPVHSSIGFDLTVTGLFSPLLAGRSVYLLPESEAGQALGETLLTGGDFSLVKITPAHLEVLSAHLPANRAAGRTRAFIIGGEALRGESLTFWQTHAPETHLINEYGPTETVVGCCVYDVPAGESIPGAVPIGRPIANTRLYVLDPINLTSTPIGVPGELYIGGEGVARGYLNRPDLTAERFVPAPPFPPSSSAGGDIRGGRLYRTGDLARWRADGNLEFLGRLDHQVKVRGFRIELGEIEATLARHASVREAVVLAREDRPGEKALVAYVAPHDGQTLAAGDLRDFLRQRLPDYMLPSAYVMLESLPLTPNGKVDRRALPAPEGAGLEGRETFVAPRDVLELHLARIWKDILNVQPIGVRQDFFDLGGHSLLALRLISRIEQELGYQLPVATLFQKSTVERLAAALRQREQTAALSSSLVPMQAGEAKKRPLFLVHAVGGDVLCYLELVRHLEADRPVYAFQAQGFDGVNPPLARVEEMARSYVDLLRLTQAEGPYLLGGWSMGGVIALEMARQLKAQGQAVSLVVLLDSHVPQGQGRGEPEPDETALWGEFALNMGIPPDALAPASDRLEELAPDDRLAYLLQQAKQLGIVPTDLSLTQANFFFQVYHHNLQAIRQHTPAAYCGPVTLFKADERLDGDDEADDLGWGAFVGGSLAVRGTPGSHYTLIRKPHVETLAERITAELHIAESKGEDSLETLNIAA